MLMYMYMYTYMHMYICIYILCICICIRICICIYIICICIYIICICIYIICICIYIICICICICIYIYMRIAATCIIYAIPPSYARHVLNKRNIRIELRQRPSISWDSLVMIYPSNTGWWCSNHLEKYEFVNGKDDN